MIYSFLYKITIVIHLSKNTNAMLLDKLAESDDIVQEKYITVTIFKNNIEEARSYFQE